MPSASPPQPGEVTPTDSRSQPKDTPLAAPPEQAQGTILYVRPDGGDPHQCTGLADAAYPGSGTGQPCAWDHPFRALPPGDPPRIACGDALIIAADSYQMGLGAPGADNGKVCHSDYPWDCHMPPIPSGADPAHPTRVLGVGADSSRVCGFRTFSERRRVTLTHSRRGGSSYARHVAEYCATT